jgi:xanthine dehydrogenase YagS FAD-binding subunit
MKAFEYAAPGDLDDAIALLSDKAGESAVMAGGTDLVTSMKQGIVSPDRVVSLKNVKAINGIQASGSDLRIGAATPLGALLAHSSIADMYPSITTAIQGIGSPQLMSIGTVGGDLLQAPRCWYYRNGMGLLADDAGAANFEGDSLAVEGDNRYHAIFDNKNAQFVNASSLAPALIALGAKAVVRGPKKKEREIDLADLYKTPSSSDEREHVLGGNEVISHINIPASGSKNGTYEVRTRQGMDWPIVTASVALHSSGPRVVLGHVAPTPWVSDAAGKALGGGVNENSAAASGDAAADGATPLSHNEYKVTLVKVAVKRAVLAAAAHG